MVSPLLIYWQYHSPALSHKFMAVSCWQEYFPATGNYFEQFVMTQTEFGVSLYEKLDYDESPINLWLTKYIGIFDHIKDKVNKKTARQLSCILFFPNKIWYWNIGELHGKEHELQTLQKKPLKLLLKLDRLTSTLIHLHKYQVNAPK